MANATAQEIVEKYPRGRKPSPRGRDHAGTRNVDDKANKRDVK